MHKVIIRFSIIYFNSVSSHREQKISTSISVLHIAMEGADAVFGGLGRVATQMMDAQNRFIKNDQAQFNAAIITPYYPHLHTASNKREICKVTHLYNDELVTSAVYLVNSGKNKHYLIEPSPQYKHMFDLHSLPEIYADTNESFFIERVKYFNSCVAAFLHNNKECIEHPNPQILQLHDWQAAFVPKLLKELYGNTTIKSVFTVHIDSGDRGTYPSEALGGIGITFNKRLCILKALGLVAADKIVAVSPKFLRECIEVKSDDPELEFLRQIFAISSAQGKTAGIGNGINYEHYCPLHKLFFDANNLAAQKKALRQEIANMLCGARLLWKFDPNLPLILYVGRYSLEKGSEVFEQIIRDTAGKATFVAVGRGMTDDVFRAMITHSRQTDNVFITASESEQATLIARLRAAADIVVVPSHRDAFGLVGPEGLANGSIIVTTGVGGLKDIVTSLDITNPAQTTGNGIFYEDKLDGDYNPDLTVALNKALGIWQSFTLEQISQMQSRIMLEAKKFDWVAAGGALDKYLALYQGLLEQDQPRILPRLKR